MNNTNDKEQRQQDEINSLKEEIQRLKRALENNLTQMRRETKTEISEQLREMGEIETCLKLYLYELRHVPTTDQKYRDRYVNLKKELEEMVAKMIKKKEGKEDTEAPKTETEEITEEVTEEVTEEEKKNLDKKIKEAKAAINDLDDRIKFFDRIERDLSTKLEILESRRLAKKGGAFLGGILILIGGMIMIGGILLSLARQEFPFVYSNFDAFFNILLIFLGGLMVGSGFLHQT